MGASWLMTHAGPGVAATAQRPRVLQPSAPVCYSPAPPCLQCEQLCHGPQVWHQHVHAHECHVLLLSLELLLVLLHLRGAKGGAGAGIKGQPSRGVVYLRGGPFERGGKSEGRGHTFEGGWRWGWWRRGTPDRHHHHGVSCSASTTRQTHMHIQTASMHLANMQSKLKQKSPHPPSHFP